MSTQIEAVDKSAVANHPESIAQPGQYHFSTRWRSLCNWYSDIKEIIDYGEITEVPMMPEFIRGVINLRGRVVPVVDLASRFGRGSTQIAKRTGIVIVETTGGYDDVEVVQQDIGIMVDAVNEVVDINGQDIEPAPAFETGVRPDFINGMAKRDGHFIILLNVNRVLSVDEMAGLSKMTVENYHISGTDLG